MADAPASDRLRRALAAELHQFLRGDPEEGESADLGSAVAEAARDGTLDALPLDVLVDALDHAGRAVGLQAPDERGDASEASYRILLQSIQEGFSIIEMIYGDDGTAVDYRFIETNPAFEQHTGLTDVTGRTVLECIPTLERRWIEAYDAVARTGESIQFQQGAVALGRAFEVGAFRVPDTSKRRVAILFTDVTERLRAEASLREANETLEEQVQARTDEVRGLARALTMAEQEVRRRIAHVLHDDLQQVLHGAQIAVQVGDTHRLDAILDRALTLTRLLAHELSPPLLSDSGIGPLLRWLSDNQGALYGLKVDVDVPESVVVPEEHLRILLYQLVRELLFNVAKHAQTRSARIRAETTDRVIRIMVEDDGVGFTPPSVDELRQSSGLGLPSVWDRLVLVGGALSIESAPGAGTRLILEIPTGAEHAG